MQPEKSPTPFDENQDLVWGVVAIIALLFVLMSVSCVSLNGEGLEPVWKPHVYLYSPSSDGRCAFVDGQKHVIDCDEPIIHEHYLAPLEDLVTLKSKLQQCENWR